MGGGGKTQGSQVAGFTVKQFQMITNIPLRPETLCALPFLVFRKKLPKIVNLVCKVCKVPQFLCNIVKSMCCISSVICNYKCEL